MIQNLKKSKKGFTLVELIVVIAILGVLAAVLVPQYIQYVDKAKTAADEQTIGSIKEAVGILAAEGTLTKGTVITWKASNGHIVVGAATVDPEVPATSVTNITGNVGTPQSSSTGNKTFTVNATSGVIDVS